MLGDIEYNMLKVADGKAVQIQQDIGTTLGALTDQQASGCLNDLFHEITEMEIQLINIQVLISISNSMKDAVDEQNVNMNLFAAIVTTSVSVSLSRKSVNGIVGYCSTVPIAATKAQELLNFLSEVDRSLQAIHGRMAPRCAPAGPC